MFVKKDFILVPEEVFRVGNGTGPRMHMVRPSEVDVAEVNGVKVIIANGRGVSLYTLDELNNTSLTGWVWKFKGNTTLPQGL